MNYHEMIDALIAERDNAERGRDWRARNTFSDMIGVVFRACVEDANKWAKHAKKAIELVKSGRYAGNYDGARRILNAACRQK